MPVASHSCRAVGVCMPLTSHIVEFSASDFIHSLRKAIPNSPPHTVDMDKNGGPNNLKAWREFRKMSQEALAAKVETTGTVISMLESGDRGLSAKWLRKLAPALSITPGHLLDHDPNDLPTDIVEIWMSADQDQKRQLVDVAKALTRAGA
jgi:transcriptional regulator with XRE-family HTH domain